MSTKYQFTTENKTWQLPMIAGVGLLLVSGIYGVIAGDMHGFWASYHVGFLFTLGITIGALFLVMIMTIAKAHWHIVIRRFHETIAWSFPVLALAGLPMVILLFTSDHHPLFEWAHKDVVAKDLILQGKSGYLNPTFFAIRYVIYFFVWSWLAFRLHKLSTQEDENPDPSNLSIGPLTRLGLKLHIAGTGEALENRLEYFQLRRLTSAWGIPISALCVAFASFDFLMSLQPHWFSTIFGVNFFIGGWVTSHAVLLLVALYFVRNGKLADVISDEHFHDMGKLMFAFTVFWAYIGVSQALLYWYANLPEETIFYKVRFESGWLGWSWFLLFGHFVMPFLLLIGRAIKRRKEALAAMAVWFLIIHFADLYWNAMPALYKTGPHYSILDLTCWLGFVFFFVGLFFYKIRQHSLVPYNDIYFQKSLHFHQSF
ncbi:MAG TPA: hypothetical protein PLO56_01755 [Rhodothermales bacterium]|nr:hypothetical protein [Rhodothermales bacterium]